MSTSLNLKSRLRSFGHAFAGIGVMLRNEPNAWIHCFAAVAVIVAGILLRISAWEWVAVVFAIGLVLAAEAFNSAIEQLSDVVQPEWDARIKDVKDLAAGAVLFCAIAAAVIGCIVFIPKILALF